MRYYIFLFCFLFTQILFTQNNSSWFKKLMIRNLVYELASDSYEGRQTGEEGGKKAGEYIFNYLNNIFKNYENVDIYNQEFEFT